MYKWQQVRAMKAKGESIKGIARKLGLSRNTVKKYARSSEPPEFKGREYEHILDGYDKEIIEMHGKGFIGTRIYNELLGIGYKGSLSTVHRHTSGMKAEDERKAKATTRVETSPGEQMQYDWKEWELPINGKPVKIYIHELVLSYSRKKYYTFSLSITGQDIIRALISGIEYFGGIAAELVIDNPKQMVITHRRDGIVYYNEEFLKFCGLYGITPKPCSNYRARTKGKAERPFYYIQEHLLRGLEEKGLPEFEEKLNCFTREYNARIHSTLKESPDNRFLREKGDLKGIPNVEPRVLCKREPRKVTNDGYVNYGGNLYPVPMKYCLREVMIEPVFGRLLKVYDAKGELISEQETTGNGIRPVHPEHEAINNGHKEKKERIRNVLVERFITLFGTTGDNYLKGLKDNTGANVYWHLSEILTCCDAYKPEVIKTAIEECIGIGSYHKNSIIRLLTSPGFKQPSVDAPLSRLPTNLSGRDITRSLGVYSGLTEVSHE